MVVLNMVLRKEYETFKNEMESLVNTLVDNVKVEKIYLFGSFAYGIPNETSDYDIYMVISDDYEKQPISVMCESYVKLGRKKYSRSIDLLAAKNTDFNKRSNIFPLESQVKKKGIMLYEHKYS